MIDQKTIDRINELYHKKQAQGLMVSREPLRFSRNALI